MKVSVSEYNVIYDEIEDIIEVDPSMDITDLVVQGGTYV